MYLIQVLEISGDFVGCCLGVVGQPSPVTFLLFQRSFSEPGTTSQLFLHQLYLLALLLCGTLGLQTVFVDMFLGGDNLLC